MDNENVISFTKITKTVVQAINDKNTKNQFSLKGKLLGLGCNNCLYVKKSHRYQIRILDFF